MTMLECAPQLRTDGLEGDYHYWLFGHYHDNKAIDEKHILLWEQIVRVI